MGRTKEIEEAIERGPERTMYVRTGESEADEEIRSVIAIQESDGSWGIPRESRTSPSKDESLAEMLVFFVRKNRRFVQNIKYQVTASKLEKASTLKNK